jgi:hypothetical protein
MNWQPTLSQLELISDMATARLSMAAMAKAVGLCEAEFIGWRMACLRATRAEEKALQARYAVEPVRTARPVPEGPKIVADRVFEHPEAEAAVSGG